MPEKTMGFDNPALQYEEKGIDLSNEFISNNEATFFWRLDSDNMAALDLPCGSLLMVDRSRKPANKQFALIRQKRQFYCCLMKKSD